MIILNVYITVKPEKIEAFKKATIENAANSAKEPGILRFDFLQEEDRPEKFLLFEVYKNEEAVLAHKETLHYAAWKKIAENMMSGERQRIKYKNIFPDDKDW